MTNQTCPICLSDITYEIKLDGCNHSYCKECFVNWNKEKNTCPLCRENIIYNFEVGLNKKNRIMELHHNKIIIYRTKKLKKNDTYDFNGCYMTRKYTKKDVFKEIYYEDFTKLSLLNNKTIRFYNRYLQSITDFNTIIEPLFVINKICDYFSGYMINRNKIPEITRSQQYLDYSPIDYYLYEDDIWDGSN